MDEARSAEVVTMPRGRFSFTLAALVKIVFLSAVVCCGARFGGIGLAIAWTGVLLGRCIPRTSRMVVTWSAGLLGGVLALVALFAIVIAYDFLSYGGTDFVEAWWGFREFLLLMAVFASASELLAKALLAAQHSWKRLVRPAPTV